MFLNRELKVRLRQEDFDRIAKIVTNSKYSGDWPTLVQFARSAIQTRLREVEQNGK